jgi:hypothetical protein
VSAPSGHFERTLHLTEGRIWDILDDSDSPPCPSDATYDYDVFLSHATRDKPAVEELARQLKAAGLEPFLDKWHLVPGVPWQEAIETALERSRTCAVFLGPGHLGPWQNEEMRDALDTLVQDKSRRVVPVLLPGASMPEKKALPPFLRRLTWVEFSDGLNDPQAFQRLVCGIKGTPPGEGPAGAELKPPTGTSPAGMWYFAQAGQQQGPVSDEQFKRMAREGSLSKHDLVWQEGMASWQPAMEIPSFKFDEN